MGTRGQFAREPEGSVEEGRVSKHRITWSISATEDITAEITCEAWHDDPCREGRYPTSPCAIQEYVGPDARAWYVGATHPLTDGPIDVRLEDEWWVWEYAEEES